MVASRQDGLLLPALAGCVLGAASVVGVSALGGVVDLGAVTGAVTGEALGGAGRGGGNGPRVVEASTAPPPFTVPAMPASSGRAARRAGAAPAGAAGAIDAVRRHRKSGTRPASTRPDTARRDQGPGGGRDAVRAAQVAPPSVTLVLERNRRGRLVTVKVIDPSRTPRLTVPPVRRTPSAPAPSTPQTWRRGTVGSP